MMKRAGTSPLLAAALGGLAALLALACGSPPPTIPPPAATPVLAAAPPAASASASTASPRPPANPYEGTLSPLTYPGERHLANVRQLTFGAENAEAYWSSDGKRLIFQSSRPPYECDQIYVMDPDDPAGSTRLVSTGQGRTTCSYFFPDGKRILYASTHLGSKRCPTPPDMSQGYVWGLFADYDIFTANVDGSDLRRITAAPGYDAEATISTDGRSIVFTSARDGDLELYAMAPDGSNVRRLTNAVGYDGGAFYSDDGEWLVYRASHPKEPAAIADFKALLSRSLIRPKTLDLHVMRADGMGDRQVTDNNAANFAPFFFRGGHDRIIFCSNLADPKGRNFDLFAVNADGTDLERITFNPTFDGFPMFSPDGKRLAFCSNRHNAKSGETNVFVADWVQ
jgi:TolB protein